MPKVLRINDPRQDPSLASADKSNVHRPVSPDFQIFLVEVVARIEITLPNAARLVPRVRFVIGVKYNVYVPHALSIAYFVLLAMPEMIFQFHWARVAESLWVDAGSIEIMLDATAGSKARPELPPEWNPTLPR
jgi:hypothetical protein